MGRITLLKQVKDYEVGALVDSFLIIKKYDIKTTSQGKKYGDLLLGDQTGEINAKIWDATPEHEALLAAHKLIKIRGTVREWNDQIQLNIERIRAVEEADNVRIEDYVPSAPYEPETMYEQVMQFVDQVESTGIKALLQRLLSEHRSRLLYYPAAMRNHHAVRAGWLYHIVTMLKLAEKVSEIYAFLNRDLLYGGIILHDLAKLEEMEADELGVVSDYSIAGNLLGHIVQGILMVDNAAKDIDIEQEELMLLQHIILSHHYKGEWGSPKSPQIPEAEIIHHLDMIDAHMFDMKQALEQVSAGDMTDKVWTLNRRLYKPKQ